MADYTQAGGVPRSGHATGGQPSRNLANTANWAGAIVSLALIAGIGIWGYRIMVRDVSGIPVVQATQGPMRIAPQDPGGQAADHQGLSVNDIAGNGIASAPPDELVLAPRPVALTDEDRAMTTIRPPAPLRPRQDVTTLAPDASSDLAASDDPVQALADQIAAGIEPLFTAPAPETEPVVTALSDVGTADAMSDAASEVAATAFEGGVARSLRPQSRPADLRVASLAPLEPVTATTSELDPAEIPVGTRLVQLGAFESDEIARAEWDRLDARFGDYLEDKSQVIERATSGGRVFYRLRAHGFADLSDARRFCSAFVSQNADCIPVVTR